MNIHIYIISPQNLVYGSKEKENACEYFPTRGWCVGTYDE